MNVESRLNNQQSANAKEDLFLVKRMREGDRGAFKKIYEKHVNRIHLLCDRIVVDRQLAEDATQEVFIQLWRSVDRYRGDAQFTTWLHSLASHTAISYLRKQKGWFQRVLHHDDEDAVVAQDLTAQNELEGLIRRLPQRARIVFVLHAVEGYRHDEVAQMTGMAVGSSKSQLHRAKQLLEEWMKDA